MYWYGFSLLLFSFYAHFCVCAVFKYHPPTTNSFTHNVYLLKNKLHYKACLIVGGRLLANATQGTGDGFCYKLTSPKHYYFACGIGNGTHCEQGFMNFGVKALLH